MADIDRLLVAVLQQCQGKTLLVADENCLDFPFPSLDKSIHILSNRLDVTAQAESAGLTAWFSDYDFKHWFDSPLDNIVYRISKEKPVVHHIANQALRAARNGGAFWLLGGKQEGIKTFAKTVGSQFGCAAAIRKEGSCYVVQLEKQAATETLLDDHLLDDQDYDRLRSIARLGGKPVLSKPGLFGWDKIDKGSALLAAYLPEFLDNLKPKATASLLDLGCGYGYLSLAAHPLGNFHITATDNCAAALIACRENFALHGIAGEVIGDDCATTIAARFDVILCNPPFHQGFQQERKLTEKFLASTKRLLDRKGRALFVVNQFVPLETLATPFFGHIRVAAADKGFKLVELAHSSR